MYICMYMYTYYSDFICAYSYIHIHKNVLTTGWWGPMWFPARWGSDVAKHQGHFGSFFDISRHVED